MSVFGASAADAVESPLTDATTGACLNGTLSASSFTTDPTAVSLAVNPVAGWSYVGNFNGSVVFYDP